MGGNGLIRGGPTGDPFFRLRPLDGGYTVESVLHPPLQSTHSIHGPRNAFRCSSSAQDRSLRYGSHSSLSYTPPLGPRNIWGESPSAHAHDRAASALPKSGFPYVVPSCETLPPSLVGSDRTTLSASILESRQCDICTPILCGLNFPRPYGILFVTLSGPR